MSEETLDATISKPAARMYIAPVTPAIAARASLMDWSHRDPFDRLIAATAIETGAPLVSVDQFFDSCAGLARLWNNTTP